MKYSKLIIIFMTILQSAVLSAQAEKIAIDSKNSAVEFMAIGSPSAIKIKGEKAKVDGVVQIENSKLQAILKVDLNSFETGMEMRDEHMKDNYLQTDRPENKIALLEIKNLNIPTEYWKNNKEINLEFAGDLTLHNVKKSIVGKILLSPYRNNSTINTISELKVKLSEYKIEIPSFAGITVAEDVKITVKLPLIITAK